MRGRLDQFKDLVQFKVLVQVMLPFMLFNYCFGVRFWILRIVNRLNMIVIRFWS